MKYDTIHFWVNYESDSKDKKKIEQNSTILKCVGESMGFKTSILTNCTYGGRNFDQFKDYCLQNSVTHIVVDRFPSQTEWGPYDRIVLEITNFLIQNNIKLFELNLTKHYGWYCPFGTSNYKKFNEKDIPTKWTDDGSLPITPIKYFNSKEEEVTEPKVGEIYSLTKRSFPSYSQIIDYCNKNDIKVDVWEKYFKWEEEENGLTKKYFELQYQSEVDRRRKIYEIQNSSY